MSTSNPAGAATGAQNHLVRGWTVYEDHGSPAALHERSTDLLAPDGRGTDGRGTDGSETERGERPRAAHGHLVRLMRPQRRAIILGSTQDASLVDAQACRLAGIEVARRRSGGGAVLVEPGGQVWVDVLIPAGSPLWSEDVVRAAWWLGDLWAHALKVAGVVGPQVWKGPMRNTRWSRLCCFAGIGPGEVVGPRGFKWVGISQRRNRHGILLQSSCLLRWGPEALLDCFDLPPAQRQAAINDLSAVAAGVGVPPEMLLEAFVSQLPELSQLS